MVIVKVYQMPNGLRQWTVGAALRQAQHKLDKVWEQEKLKARKLPENAQTPTSGP